MASSSSNSSSKPWLMPSELRKFVDETDLEIQAERKKVAKGRDDVEKLEEEVNEKKHWIKKTQNEIKKTKAWIKTNMERYKKEDVELKSSREKLNKKREWLVVEKKKFPLDFPEPELEQ